MGQGTKSWRIVRRIQEDGRKQLCILAWFSLEARLTESQWCVCVYVHVCDCPRSNLGIEREKVSKEIKFL